MKRLLLIGLICLLMISSVTGLPGFRNFLPELFQGGITDGMTIDPSDSPVVCGYYGKLCIGIGYCGYKYVYANDFPGVAYDGAIPSGVNLVTHEYPYIYTIENETYTYIAEATNCDPGYEYAGRWWEYYLPVNTSFTSTSLYGVSPVTIQFIDLSTNSPTNWYWEITNNLDSSVITNTTQNPSITFYDQGIYSVSLISGNEYMNDTEIKNDYITVSSPSTPSTKSMEIIGGMNILYFTVIATFLVIVIYLISLFIKVEV